MLRIHVTAARYLDGEPQGMSAYHFTSRRVALTLRAWSSPVIFGVDCLLRNGREAVIGRIERTGTLAMLARRMEN
jgi:hypothetical protein